VAAEPDWSTADTIPRQTREDYREKWAVIVGIDPYKEGSGFRALTTAAADARKIWSTLRDEFGYIAGNDERGKDGHMLLVLNEEATQEAILSAFHHWLPGKHVDPDDAVFVFFAGHGERREGQGYLAAVDSKRSDLETTGVPLRLIEAALLSLKCRHKALVIDSCSSGSVFAEEDMLPTDATPKGSVPTGRPVKPGRQTAPGNGTDVRAAGSHSTDLDRFLWNSIRGSAFFCLASAGPKEGASDRGEGGHSIFTHHLLNVLEERADSERTADHVFTFSRMAGQVAERVASSPQGGQVPIWGRREPGSGEFIFRPTFRRLTSREATERAEFNTRIKSAYSAWKSGRYEEARTLLGSGSDHDLTGVTAGFSWRFVNRLVRPSVEVVIEKGSPLTLWSYSTAEDLLASGDAGGTLRLRNLATRRLLGEALQHPSAVGDAFGHFITDLALGRNGTLLVSAGSDGTVKAWDVREMRCMATFTSPGNGSTLRPASLAFGNEDQVLAICWPRCVRLVEIEEWQTRQEVSSENRLTCTAFSRDGRTLLLGREDGCVEVVGLDLGKERHVVKIHDAAVMKVTFSSVGTQVASYDMTELAVWDYMDRTVAYRHSRSDIGGIQFSPDGKYLAVSGGSRFEPSEVVVLNSDDGQEVAKTRMPNVVVTGVFFCGDRQSLCLAGADGSVRLWHRPVAEDMVMFPVAQHILPDIAFDNQSDRVAAACTMDKKVRVFRVADCDKRMDLDCSVGPVCVAFDPRGTNLAVGDGKEIKIWNTVTGVCLESLKGHEDIVLDIVWRPGREELLSCGRDGSIRIWDLGESGSREIFRSDAGSVRSLSITQDGAVAASGGDDKIVRLWDLETWSQLGTLEGHGYSVCKVAFSPDGRSICSADGGFDRFIEMSGPGAIIMWDVERGWERWRGQGVFCGMEYSPDGENVATIGMAFPLGEVTTWDAMTGAQFTLYTRTSYPQSISFSGDSGLLGVGIIDIQEFLKRKSADVSQSAVLAIWDARTPSAVQEKSGADRQ